jgi:hypothetical protein
MFNAVKTSPRGYLAASRRRRPRPSDRWHLDGMVVRIAGERMYLWRAVDHEGRLMRKLLRKQGFAPKLLVTDKRSGGVFADLDSIVVEVGDLVFIRYDDQPDRRLSIRLSDSENNPGDGVVHVSQPLGTAIFGASLDEEITVKIGNRTRTAVIEKIEKPRPVQALAAE